MKIISFIIMLLISFSFMEDEKIPWSVDRKLSWEDFRGIPNQADDFVASTNSGISFSFSIQESNQNRALSYNVVSNFYPDLSWYRPDRVSEYILKHEQTHFDISELFARKLRKELAQIENEPDFQDLAKRHYEQIEAQRREMQLHYDKESDHSNKEADELRWRKYIAAQLAEYDAWK